MDGYAKLKELLQGALGQAAEESSMLLGQELGVSGLDGLRTNKLTYFSDMDDAVFVVAVESREEYQGCFYMLFSLRDAIVMSGILLGIPMQRITEKTRLLIIEKDDTDAFSEIANQIIGSFNSVFQPALPKKVHLKQLPPKNFIPQSMETTPEEPIPDGEYVLLQAGLSLPEREMGKVSILIPVDLADRFDPPAEAAASPEDVEVGAPEAESAGEEAVGEAAAPDGEEGGEAILVMAASAERAAAVAETFSGTGIRRVTLTAGEDPAALFARHRIVLAVIDSDNPQEEDFAACAKFVAMARNRVPVVMCAGQWSRLGTLKAVRSGARDVLLRPCGGDEVASRLEKLMKAA